MKLHKLFDTLQSFQLEKGKQGRVLFPPQLEKAGVGPVSKLPVSIQLVLESLLRNCDGKRVSEQHSPGVGQLETECRAQRKFLRRGPYRVTGFYRRAALVD
jgi:hypothetical protein